MTTSTDVFERIRAHGSAAYPEEACGLLLGTFGGDGVFVTETHPAGNRHAGRRERRYLITPDAYHEATKAASERGLEVVGFYHSHPDHPARPSKTDLREATFPGYVYVIVSVREGVPEDLTAWTLAPDRSRFIEESIRT